MMKLPFQQITKAAAMGVLAGLFAGCASHPAKMDATARTNVQPPLVTGKLLEERFADASTDVGSLPMNLIATPDGRFAISSDMGAREAVCAVSTTDGKGTGRVDFPAGPARMPSHTNGLYYGLAIGPDNTIYAAQGAHAAVVELKLAADGSLTRSGKLDLQSDDFPAGLALDSRGLLYIASNNPGPEFGTPASVVIYDTKAQAEVGRYHFSDSFAGTSNFPLCVAVLNNG